MHLQAIIYTPLQEEYESLQARFRPERDIDGETYTGYIAKGQAGEDVAVIAGFEWGNEAAYHVMKEILGQHTCRLAICIGIAGGISKDAKLGDVFYSKHVLDLTQRMKQEKDKNGKTRIKYDPDSFPSDKDIAKSLDRSRMSATGKSPYRSWKSACEMVNAGRLVGVTTQDILGQPSSHYKVPEATGGKIASTNMVLADSDAVEDVRECGRKMACVDTESAGFAKACSEIKGLSHIVIRGISDTADESKKLAEDQFKNVFRQIAASNAALFLQHNLTRMLAGITVANSAKETVKVSMDEPATALSSNEQEIREELLRRSIVFKTIEQEYKMPVPRLRKAEVIAGKKSKKLPAEQEVEEVLGSSDRVLVQLPDHYPDTALPWLFAHLLTEAGLHGRYTVPVCVKWSEFGPPRNTLDAQLEERKLLFTKNAIDYHIVFILVDARLGSKTKAQFLLKEIEGFQNASLMIFPDRNEAGIYENELDQQLKPETFNVEGISFASITKYMKDNFGMSVDEAEVVATRLMSTFSNYRLKVHPTYLASIQKDTVLSFIEANQRGELIELAVAGLLSLIIADDPSKVVLRRGTRERFLAQLAVDIYSEKYSFDETALENYVKDYAERMGFDITPSQFIKTFVDNGVISFEGGKAQISVPVIRTYMLAKGLVANGDSGMKYFDFNSIEFDHATFDLFSEFSNDRGLYETVSKHLSASIDFFEAKLGRYNSVIKDGDFSSHLLMKSLDLSKLSKDISRQGEKLVEVSSLVSEKQARMDVQAEIAQSSTAKRIDISDPDSFYDEHVAIARFVAGVVMLGAAAEKMQDQEKLIIIQRILTLAGLVTTDLLTIYSTFDVKAAATEVVDQIRKSGEVTFDDESAEGRLDKFVELVVAEFEFNLAANPMHAMLSLLCEAGRTNVLLSPIMRVELNSPLEEFYRRLWAFDMDPQGKSHLPRDLSKSLGHSPFLRMVFGIFIINRIYWFHHGKPKKEALLKGVNEVFKPLSIKSDVELKDINSEEKKH